MYFNVFTNKCNSFTIYASNLLVSIKILYKFYNLVAYFCQHHRLQHSLGIFGVLRHWQVFFGVCQKSMVFFGVKNHYGNFSVFIR